MSYNNNNYNNNYNNEDGGGSTSLVPLSDAAKIEFDVPFESEMAV